MNGKLASSRFMLIRLTKDDINNMLVIKTVNL